MFAMLYFKKFCETCLNTFFKPKTCLNMFCFKKFCENAKTCLKTFFKHKKCLNTFCFKKTFPFSNLKNVFFSEKHLKVCFSNQKRFWARFASKTFCENLLKHVFQIKEVFKYVLLQKNNCIIKSLNCFYFSEKHVKTCFLNQKRV